MWVEIFWYGRPRPHRHTSIWHNIQYACSPLSIIWTKTAFAAINVIYILVNSFIPCERSKQRMNTPLYQLKYPWLWPNRISLCVCVCTLAALIFRPECAVRKVYKLHRNQHRMANKILYIMWFCGSARYGDRVDARHIYSVNTKPYLYVTHVVHTHNYTTIPARHFNLIQYVLLYDAG